MMFQAKRSCLIVITSALTALWYGGWGWQVAIARGQAGSLQPISQGWTATDALGRSLPNHAVVGDPRQNRAVAMFYWTWHVGRKTNLGPANVQQILEAHPEAAGDYHHPIWKQLGSIVGYHWNEPLFGYYHGTDPWVYRRHAMLLADAGVDLVVFDCTNGTLTWKEAYDVLAGSWMEARRDGVATLIVPHIWASKFFFGEGVGSKIFPGCCEVIQPL